MTMGQVADAEHRFNHRATARQSTLNFRARPPAQPAARV
jgi:hypothetical protein